MTPNPEGCSEPEPADSPRDKSAISGGRLQSLTSAIGDSKRAMEARSYQSTDLPRVAGSLTWDVGLLA